jgi:hypothetical protein
LDNGGSVGIGTAAPTALLDLNNTSATNGLAFKGVTTLQQTTGDEVAYQLNYTTNKLTSGNDTGLLIKKTETASPGTSYLIDAQTGSTSQFRVDDAGMGYFASGIYVGAQQLAVPDYVFEGGYDLMPLDDLASYIAFNRHLPGILSEKEIQKNGLNYSTMIMGLLEKTEENTLYILGHESVLDKQDSLLSGLSLKTDGNIATLKELQTSIDKQLGIAGETFRDIQAKIKDQETLSISQQKSLVEQADKIKKLESLTAILEQQIEELKKITSLEISLTQIEANVIDIAYLRQLLGLETAESGDIILLGKLEAEKVIVDGVETGGIVIKVRDEEAPTIGEATIQSGETKIVVATGAVDDNSNVFTAIKSKLTSEAT